MRTMAAAEQATIAMKEKEAITGQAVGDGFWVVV